MLDKRPGRTSTVQALAMLGLLAGALPADAATADDDRWHFQVIPYLWLPVVDSSVDVTVNGLRGRQGQDLGTVSLSAETDPNNYLSDLRAALMLLGEARKGPWSIFTDLVYTRFEGADATARAVAGPLGQLSGEIGREAELEISATIGTLGGGYRVIDDPAWNLDLFAGFRYLTMSTDVGLTLAGQDGRFTRSRQASVDQDALDGIVGLRGQYLIPDARWFIPYYLDVGAGSSNWTWQGLVGAGYRFDWGEVTLALRSLGYEFDHNNADVQFTGPALGVGFRW